MSYTSLVGLNIDDFVEQGPEREGITEISNDRLVITKPDDAVLAPLSKASRRILLQIAAMDQCVLNAHERVKATDSRSQYEAFQQDVADNILPLTEILVARSTLQLAIDVRANGGDPSKYSQLLVTREHKIIGVSNVREALMRIDEARRSA
ncbi:MAG TPA: hypothetical protein VEB18_01135 [Candidatus Paceibacterota bacterium]|nr:hypothetical protein [Candidatus Paceibacterota bacterium]